MIIRAIGKTAVKVKQSLRQFANTPTSCKGCQAVRNAVKTVLPAKPRK